MLRSLATKVDLPNELDLPNVVEEIEYLGNSQLRSVRRFMRLMLSHLILIAVDADTDSVGHWTREAATFRGELALSRVLTLIVAGQRCFARRACSTSRYPICPRRGCCRRARNSRPCSRGCRSLRRRSGLCRKEGSYEDGHGIRRDHAGQLSRWQHLRPQPHDRCWDVTGFVDYCRVERLYGGYAGGGDGLVEDAMVSNRSRWWRR